METITNFFAQQGILGIIILMETSVIVWQQKRIDKKDSQILELQDKRVNDTNTFTNGYTEISKEMVAAGRDTANSISILQKTIDTILSSLQTLLNKQL